MGAGTDQLFANESLQHGQSIQSGNGAFQTVFQSDGNLVLYRSFPGFASRALWASDTSGHPADTCVMQGDGNLVVYDPGGHAIWAAGSNGNAGGRLVMQNDGNLVIYRPNGSPAWASNTVHAVAPSGPAAQGSQMFGGQTIPRNQSIRSANNRYLLAFQGDGNLVLYKTYLAQPSKALWASNTNGRPSAVCILQTDGNLVLYDPDAHALWSSGTNGNGGARLVVQDDGNVVIYRANGSPAWATNTVQAAVPTGPTAHGDTMHAGEVLNDAGAVASANGRYTLVRQSDGNLVLYKRYVSGKRQALWASGTNGHAIGACVMQGDGNLVLYDTDGHAVWASGTNGHPGSRLAIQDDGNVVIYAPNGSALWSTGTYGMLVHFKTLLPLTTAIQAYLDGQYAAMDELYIDGRVNTTRGTTEDLSGDLSLASLLALDIGDCMSSTHTADQIALFGHRNDAHANDLVVYLVSSLVGGAGNFVGCASHPAGQPACAIVQTNADWLTAHEVGHVLGLQHVDAHVASNQDALMWPADNWTNLPPNLSATEYGTMRASDLTPVH